MNFFSKILKQKKIFLGILFFVCVFLFFAIKIEPISADARDNCITNCNRLYSDPTQNLECIFGCPSPGAETTVYSTKEQCETACKVSCYKFTISAGIGSSSGWRCDMSQFISIPNGPDALADNPDFGFLAITTDIFVGFTRIILWFCWRIAIWVSTLFSSVVAYWVSDVNITGIDSPFLSGWGMVRDLANMLIVLGFVIVGIATTLRIQEYQAKKLLPKLIIIALLINFSGLFCGIIIDASNITFKYFAQGDGNTGNIIVNSVSQSGRNLLNFDFAKNHTTQFVTQALMYSIIYIVVAITFIYLSIILIARYAILAMLYILSPIAFVFCVFPASKKLWTEWWNHFLKWCFVAVIGGFFLNIATIILPTSNAGNSNNWTLLIIGLLFIFLGFKITAKSSGLASMASTAVMGLAAGGAGLAMGAIAGGAKGLASVSGLKGLAQRGGQAVKDKATAAGERLKLVQKGTTATNKANRLVEPTKKLDNIKDNNELAKIAEQRAFTAPQMEEKAAAAALLAKRNAFDTVDPRKRDAVAAHATAFGVSKDTFTKGTPQTLVGSTDKEAIDLARYNESKTLQKTGMSAGDAWKSTEKYVPKPDEIRDAKASLEKRKITQNALGLSPVTEKDAVNKLIENEQKHFINAGYTQAEAMDLSKKYKPKDYEISSIKQSLADEKIDKGFAKLDVGGIRALPKEALTSLAFLKNVGAKQLGTAGPRMSQDKIQKAKKLLDNSTEEGKAVDKLIADLSAKSTAGDAHAEKERAEIKRKLTEIRRW